MKDTWLSPGEITFQRDEMLWLILVLDILDGGEWPPDPDAGTAAEVPYSRRPKRQAKFITPTNFHAEVTWRLERTGEDGKILYWQVQSGITDYELLEVEAKNALNYISGWRRRRLSFSNWKKQNNYRGGAMRFNGKQDLSKIQIQERDKRKKNSKR